MPGMRMRLAVALVACLAAAILAVGCGSGSSSSSTSGTQQTSPSAPPTTEGGTGSEAGGETAPAPEAPETQTAGKGTGEEFGKNDPYSAPKGGDNSIQTYGSEAGGAEKEAVTDAMFAFFRAMAAKNYHKVCEGVSAKTRKGVEQFMKFKHEAGAGCPKALGQLLNSSPGASSEAKRAAEGSVGHVRIGESNAFILFTPKGGKPSYFVMTNEGGAWKATGFNTGVALTP
jgi:hypothetical protein